MSDLIDRQAAIDALRKMQTYKLLSGDDMLLIDQAGAQTELMMLPPAQPAKVATDINVGDKDTISRKAAIEEIERWLGYIDDDMVRRMQIGMKRLPPAQPEPKRGKWIKISPANIYECSECGKSVMTIDICAYDFCHGCGADMREEKEK